MISPEFLSAQMGKLSCLERAPRGAAALGAISHALTEVFQSEAAMGRWVDDWMRQHPECPRPSHIHEARKDGQRDEYANAIAERVKARQEADPHCTDCAGYGQVPAWHLITYDGGRKKTIERITFEQYQELGPKLNKATQRVYNLPVPCGCRGPA